MSYTYNKAVREANRSAKKWAQYEGERFDSVKIWYVLRFIHGYEAVSYGYMKQHELDPAIAFYSTEEGPQKKPVNRWFYFLSAVGIEERKLYLFNPKKYLIL